MNGQGEMFQLAVGLSAFVGTYRLVVALALLYEVLQAVYLRVVLCKVLIYIYKP